MTGVVAIYDSLMYHVACHDAFYVYTSHHWIYCRSARPSPLSPCYDREM